MTEQLQDDPEKPSVKDLSNITTIHKPIVKGLPNVTTTHNAGMYVK